MNPTEATRPQTFTFDQLRENKYLYERLNALCGMTEYKQHDRFYNFSNGTNCWRFDGFITDAQWKKLAQLCIRFNANIAETIRNFTFETEYISIIDDGNRIDYEVPTSMRGFVGNMFFGIDELGESNT